MPPIILLLHVFKWMMQLTQIILRSGPQARMPVQRLARIVPSLPLIFLSFMGFPIPRFARATAGSSLLTTKPRIYLIILTGCGMPIVAEEHLLEQVHLFSTYHPQSLPPIMPVAKADALLPVFVVHLQ